MPQIANQDYTHIAPKAGRLIEQDAAALAKIASALLNRTIFDCILSKSYDFRVIAASSYKSPYIAYYDEDKANINELNILYTPKQYSALSIIQLEEDRLEKYIVPSIPILICQDGVLYDDTVNYGYGICTPEGYQYGVTLKDGNIVTVKVTEQKIDGLFIAIAPEDAQNLIGLPCSE